MLKWSNYGKLFLFFIVGFGLAYFVLPTKTITREVKVVEYVQTNSQTHSVATTAHGVTTVVTDNVSNSTSNTSLQSFEKIEINKKRFLISPVIGYNMQEKYMSYGIIANANIYGSFGITGGGLFNEKATTVLMGVSINF